MLKCMDRAGVTGETITLSGTAAGATALTEANRNKVSHAAITTAGTVRFTTDGTTPEAAVGLVLPLNQILIVPIETLEQTSFFSASADVRVEYFSERK